jgi:hypothetical protein
LACRSYFFLSWSGADYSIVEVRGEEGENPLLIKTGWAAFDSARFAAPQILGSNPKQITRG